MPPRSNRLLILATWIGAAAWGVAFWLAVSCTVAQLLDG
jgi:hypothetical protein